MNNHWAWFHVMEHQSSHLGQILLIKKKDPIRAILIFNQFLASYKSVV